MRFVRVLLLLTVGFLPLTQSSTANEIEVNEKQNKPRKILFDTDPAGDDIVALLWLQSLARQGYAEIVAVTTVAGQAGLRARLAARLLVLGDREDVDVCVGECEALLRPGRFGWFRHEESMLGDGPEGRVSDEPAPERIVRAAREVEGLEIVMIGPMTNLARALALDLASDGVRVNAGCPAGVMTPLMQEWADTEYDPRAALEMVDSWHPLGRMATIEEIGEVCAFLASSEASFVTGQTICPDGGAMLGYRR